MFWSKFGTLVCVSVALFSLVAQGCGKSSGGVVVSGKVTYSGRPVQAGYVTFVPADGKGPSVGGPIQNGEYKIAAVPPGEKIVTITGGGEIQFPKTSDEMEQLTAKGNSIAAPVQIPPDAKGNKQRITVSSESSQTIDFVLDPPGK
jgi:hypothetical protein